MSTVQLSSRGFAEAGPDVETPAAHLPRSAGGPSRAPSALMIALLLLVLYAAFAHGADSDPAEARVQVGLSALAALAGVAWLWSGTVRVTARPIALAGLGLLGAFAVWSGITLLWSVAPNQTWLELNRVLAYVIVLALGFAAGASHRRPLETVATGYLLVALAVSLYALGQKVLPGVNIPGLIDLNQTSQYARLQAPLDYWDALALFVALAVPIALVIVVDVKRPRRIRMASLLAVELLLLVLGLTYSRGGLIAIVVAVAVSIGLGGARLKTLMMLGVAAVTTALPLQVALSTHALSGESIALGQRESAGGTFAVVLLVSLVVLFLAGRKLLDLEQRVVLTPERVRQIVRLLLAGVGAVIVIGVIAVALSSRGLGGSISHAVHSFTTPHGSDINTPDLSASSTNRWVWWKEAVGAWSDRPFGGWGAGSFPVLDLLYRTSGALSVQDAHSVPLQWLAETGLFGALLALGGYGLLLAGGLDAVRRRVGGDRAIAAALFAGAVAYAVHSFYDWDWDMPGVTFPVLVFLGVLAGSGVGAWTRHGPGRAAGTRALALAVCTFALCVFAISAVLPSLAASKANSALTQAGATSSATGLESAEATAELASRLDPLSDAGLIAAASIAGHLRRQDQTRSYLLQAVRRDPSDEAAWTQLASLELGVGDVRASRQAVSRVLELDRYGAFGHQLTLQLAELIAPPNDSATATSTPLPPG